MTGSIKHLKISAFKDLLLGGRRIGVDFHNMLDGGAAAGHMAKQMLPALTEGHAIYAFEPFPGNHRFFTGIDPRINLIRKALGATTERRMFHVSSSVTADSAWGKRGMEGYSSVGHLVDGSAEKTSGDVLEVDCVRADEELSGVGKIGFVKLDLQGGELDALRGLKGVISDVKLMYIEFSKTTGILEILQDYDFEVYDTHFLFRGEYTANLIEHFEVARGDVTSSTGKKSWHGYRKEPWEDYVRTFKRFRASGLIQTDLVCVARGFVKDFGTIVQNLGIQVVE